MSSATEAATARSAPVSGLQRGLWFLDQWNPGTATYNIPWIFTFTGSVDPAFLEHALNTVVTRHEALRTTFALLPEGPGQLVHDGLHIPLDVTDLRELPEDEQRRRAGELIAAEAATPFDLSAGPLLRASLLHRGENGTALVLVVHHIVWDGWSADVFETELAEVYTALTEQRPPVLPELTTQYADYAAEEAAGSFEEHLAYWKDRLAGAPGLLELPTDRPRPDVPTHRGRTTGFGLPAGTADRVRALAETEGVTPFMVQLAAFAALLNQYTGAEDMIVGTPVTTRNRPELENLVGYFVNLLPLRIRLDAGITFRELLHHVEDVALDAYGYLDAPFDTIVDHLGLDRSVQHAPLVQVVFGSHTEDRVPLRFGPASAARRTQSNGTTKFDLTWSLYDDGELRGEAEFRSDLFDTDSVRRMADDWRTLLAAALEAPGRTVRELTGTEASPAGPVHAPEGRTLHRLFEEAADAYGDRTALTCGATSLTYRELDERANRLAHALIARGVRPGDRVGLLLDRTEAIPVSVLGVLKAGAAYVPVDLTAPADRAATVFGDTGATVVISDRPDRVPPGPWHLLEPAAVAPLLAALPATRPAVAVRPGDTAYIIFTSGSTGRPKGVAVAHEHVSRLMASGAGHFDFTPREGQEVWTLFHSYAFDWTVWELWGALHHGGRLVVVPYVTSRSPEEFVELLAEEGVSFLCLTPSALRQLELTLRGRPRELPALRQIMLGGEALDPAVVDRWYALSPRPPARLCNLYGITETTVHVTTHDIERAEGFERSLIGTPMPHLSAVVLDDWLRPCPVGVPGELYIGGGSLAHGYWARPGLTATRFVADPYAAVPGARLYRTGDVAKRLPGGGLEYVGRADFQVKLRGFRIELGEIESALTAHPDVEACVVSVHDQRLAAYVTGREPAGMREFLARSLPEYMIPATVTVLGSLPLTVNGKIDRAALPAPGPLTGARPGAGHVAPRTAVERVFAAVWAEVLGITDIGVHDDFFHLGGDSIRAVQLAGRLHESGWAVTLRDVFNGPTIAALAPLARPVADTAGAAEPFALVDAETRAELPVTVVDAYPMVSMQLGMVFHMEIAGGTDSYHNVNSYEIAGPLDEDAFRRSVIEAMGRHPVLRTGLDLSGYREPLQLVHGDLPPPVAFEDLRGLSGEERDARVLAVFEQNRSTPFDLMAPPLFRITVQRLTDASFQLTICEHHAILDGWSFTSLMTELLERHTELAADPGAEAAAPPRSTFRDFVTVEREAAADPDSLAYWRAKLDGVSAELWEGAGATHELARTVERVLPDAPGQLRRVADTTAVPVKSVALAAHLRALQRITGRRRVTTGLAMNGRLERLDGTEVYGLFLNTVPLVAEPRDDDPLALVRAAHREELEMMPHRRVPVARLARLMAGPRLDSQFGFLRFHALGQLSDARIVDGRIGCEPTMRHEPNSFAFGASLIQDPVSDRVLLAVDHQRSVVPDELAEAFMDAYAAALAELDAAV
ncbi:amino acid adenylation domain-containing protein [Streptomyces sp. NPDC006632]|uniref:amino acid adenylation domain-containing protein n=1 Tax=Streptomyces sp. NPDC006632 TaxID=3157182 RepID=UPI0033A8893C